MNHPVTAYVWFAVSNARSLLCVSMLLLSFHLQRPNSQEIINLSESVEIVHAAMQEGMFCETRNMFFQLIYVCSEIFTNSRGEIL